MDTIVQKWGNSLGIRIPNNLVKEYDLKKGTHVEIIDDNGKIVLLPKNKFSLDELLDRITDENKHGENYDIPTGKEQW